MYNMTYCENGAYLDMEYGNNQCKSMDIQSSPAANLIMLAFWIVCCLLGLAIMFLGKHVYIGVAVIAVPTFIGMVIKPTFALSLMAMSLTSGTGISYQGMFTMDRAVGIALAVSFALNLIIIRPKLSLRNKFIWLLFFYTIWVTFVSLIAPQAGYELRYRAFTQFQLLALAMITFWIIETNGERALVWMLRSYVIGTVGSTLVTFATGAAMSSTMHGVESRMTATLGQEINANLLAAFIGLAFIAALYLIARDRSILWRIVYLGIAMTSPLLLIRTGSRAVLAATAFTILSPILFVRQIFKKPVLIVFLICIIIFVSVAGTFLMGRGQIDDPLSQRLTDVQKAKKAISYRLALIKSAISVSLQYPMGTSDSGWFFRSGQRHYPHNDFFYTLAAYGYPGAFLLTLMILSVVFSVRRMPLGWEKIYTRSVLIFILIIGLSGGHTYKKFFWMFLVIILATESISHANEYKRKLQEDELIYGQEPLENQAQGQVTDTVY